MRIALVNHRDWIEGGMDKVVLVHQEELRQRGHTVEVFAQHHPKNQPSPYRGFFPRNADRESYRPGLKSLHRIPLDLARTFYNPEAGRDFGRFLEAFRPDVVHVHGLMRAFSPAIYDSAIQRRIPVVQTHHYVKLACPTGKLLKQNRHYCSDMPCLSGSTLPCVQHRCLDGSLLKSGIAAMELARNRDRYRHQPDCHLAPSRYLQHLLAGAGVPPKKLVYHPNAVDTRCFRPRPLGQTREPYFLYFGRLAPEKGVMTLLDAIAPLRHIPLVLVGTGPLEAECRKRIETEQLHHVRLVGNLSQAELIPWIQSARATILPSLWGEIFGLTLIESMACATPVIGSRVGAIAEIISHGQDGFLVEPGNVSDLQNALIDLSEASSTVIERMGYAGLEKVNAQYSLETHMEQLLDIYDRLCTSPAIARSQQQPQKEALACTLS